MPPDSKDKPLFEFLQENLEKNCEYLHELSEKPLEPFFDQNVVDEKLFLVFRRDLINYFQVTRKFRLNLLADLEKGLLNS
mmetsp:Transcript_38140/g.36503  ORF Transcript_38140/g.36503 Transcript_38140/m.36503 type:complete len:80 (-) Transcript_38140:21-260(-)